MTQPIITPSTPALKYLPSVLAFRRSLIVTDAPFFYETSDGRIKPLPVISHGVMGTQNVNEKTPPADKSADKNADKVAASDKERDVRNLQQIETAKTGSDMESVIVEFQIKMLDLHDAFHSCANTQAANRSDSAMMRAMTLDFIARAKESEGLRDVCNRIARNILNGRWLWRNRTMATTLAIEVAFADTKLRVENALSLPTTHFQDFTPEEDRLGGALLQGLRGDPVAISVRAQIFFGVKGAFEVFCSQNYEPDVRKSSQKNELSRSLYKLPLDRSDAQDSGLTIVGQAAFRDAKIWNALRTIDTWYPDFEEVGAPMPIEPLGASLSLMRFTRGKKTSAFELFKRLPQIDPNSDDGKFCMAILLRGGVLGEEEKNRSKPEKEAVLSTDAADAIDATTQESLE